MAFLDNSGDIILDAVLTDTGRRAMADGTFSITKFGLGDDEIDYALYNINHPSGSAYADLEILQTPILEAYTGTNAGVNFGLLSTTATELLYLPVTLVNETTSIQNAASVMTSASAGSQVYYCTDNNGDDSSTSTTIALKLGTTHSLTYMNGTSATSTGKSIVWETGLNTSEIKGSSANRTSKLEGQNLIDTSYYIFFDGRFFTSPYGLSTSGTELSFGGTTLVCTLGTLVASTATSVGLEFGLPSYVSAEITAAEDQIYYTAGQTTSDTTVSSIAGPRGTWGALAMGVKDDLDTEYTLYGTTGATGTSIFGTSDTTTYDYIDTVVYIQGNLTATTLQLPVRIIRINTV